MTTLTFTANATADQISDAIRDADHDEPLVVVLTAGTYNLDQPIKILRDDVTLKGDGVGQTILKVAALGGNAGGNAQAIEVYSNAETAVSTLKSTTMSDSSTAITLNDASGIAAGMVIKIQQENTQSYFDETGNTHLNVDTENAAGHYLRQMLAEVTAVDGNTVYLKTKTPYAFTGSDSGESVVAKVSIPKLLEGIEISDFTVTSDLPGTPDKYNFNNVYELFNDTGKNSAIEITGVRGMYLHDVTSKNVASTAFSFDKMYDSKVDDLVADGTFNKGPDGNGYAFLLKTSFNNTLTDLRDVDMRHSVIFGSFTAEHYNDIHVISTNRDINFHGSPDSRNTIVVDSSKMDYLQFEGSKSAVQPGNPLIHPDATIDRNDVTFKFLSGSFAQDVAHGFDGGSELWGNQNQDQLYGGAGSDVISGGIDNDVLSGGAGQDRFIFRRTYEQDTVTDFQSGSSGDTLDLSKTGIANRDGLSVRQVGGDTMVSLGGGDSLMLKGIDMVEFNAAKIIYDTSTSVKDVFAEAYGSDLGYCGGRGNDTFALRPGNFDNGSKPDLLGMGGIDTLRIISGSSFDAAKTGRTVGMDVLDVTQTPNLAQVSLNKAFAAQADAKYVTVKYDGTGMFLKTGDITDWNAVRLSGNGLVQLSSDGASVSSAGGAINVIGGAKTDSIKGREGNDRIDGGGGRDNLAGGTGDDAFVFTKAASSASADVVSDFTNTKGNDDHFELDNAIYADMYDGWLSSSRFKLVSSSNLSAGVDSNDRILYDKANGDIYFDRDGSGGAYGRIKIAEVRDNADLSHADFLTI